MSYKKGEVILCFSLFVVDVYSNFLFLYLSLCIPPFIVEMHNLMDYLSLTLWSERNSKAYWERLEVFLLGLA